MTSKQKTPTDGKMCNVSACLLFPFRLFIYFLCKSKLLILDGDVEFRLLRWAVTMKNQLNMQHLSF